MAGPSKKGVSNQEPDALVENFDVVESMRLAPPAVLKNYPTIEDLLNDNKISKSIEQVKEVDASGNTTHDEIIAIREVIVEEAHSVLSQLKAAEVSYCQRRYLYLNLTL